MIQIPFYDCVIFHYIYHNFFIPSPVNRHLDCFHVLDIVNSGKTLNLLTLDVCFSLINSNLTMFQLHEFFCKNSYISWFLPYLFRTVPRSYLRGCILGLHPQYVH